MAGVWGWRICIPRYIHPFCKLIWHYVVSVDHQVIGFQVPAQYRRQQNSLKIQHSMNDLKGGRRGWTSFVKIETLSNVIDWITRIEILIWLILYSQYWTYLLSENLLSFVRYYYQNFLCSNIHVEGTEWEAGHLVGRFIFIKTHIEIHWHENPQPQSAKLSDSSADIRS